MHHSQFIDDEGTPWHMNHNDDFSGDVLFLVPTEKIQAIYGKNDVVEVSIPFIVLKMLVQTRDIGRLIEKLEEEDPDELLNWRLEQAAKKTLEGS